MPGLNQRGPLGQGPLSGGRQGLCGQENASPSTGENEILQKPAAGGRGGGGCRRRGGSGRGSGQGAGMGRRTTR